MWFDWVLGSHLHNGPKTYTSGSPGAEARLSWEPGAALKAPLFHVTAGIREFFRNF
jgi:hypothetical protein